MHCFMCLSSDSKLQLIKTDVDNETVSRIMCVLPNCLIPESMDPVLICSTCLEQVSFFYTIKKACLQNCSRLKYFNAMLKAKNNLKCNEIRVVLKKQDATRIKEENEEYDECSQQPGNYEVNLATRIKEENKEYDDCSQQPENYEVNLNHSQDKGSSSSSTDSSQYHKNSQVDKKDSNSTFNNIRHEGQPKTQRGSIEKKFKCTDCHKAFAYRSELETHSRMHTGEKPFKCTTCQKTFSRRSHLKSHQLTHTGEKPHECDVCHKTFNQKTNLVRHKLVHNNVRPFQCVVCSKGFTHSITLTRHMFTHTGEKPHQCHLCEYKCSNADNLKTHIRRHTGEKPHSCKHCKKSFTTTSELKKHKRRRHSNENSD